MVPVGSMKTVNGGFTLLEVMVVIGIIGMMASIIMSTSVQQLEKSRSRKTQADLKAMKGALDIYAMEEGRGKYPGKSEDVIAAMESQGVTWNACRDGWDQPYAYYVSPDRTKYYLLSPGSGGVAETDDDIFVSEKQNPTLDNPSSIGSYEKLCVSD